MSTERELTPESLALVSQVTSIARSGVLDAAAKQLYQLLAEHGGPSPISFENETFSTKVPTPRLDDELALNKRLDAFRHNNSTPSSLQPVHYPGRGRVLVNPKVEGRNHSETMSGFLDHEESFSDLFAPNLKVTSLERSPTMEDIQRSLSQKIAWPDSEFPWRTRQTEQELMEQCRNNQRLAHIRSYLGLDSDGDDDDRRTGPELSQEPRFLKNTLDEIAGDYSDRLRRLKSDKQSKPSTAPPSTSMPRTESADAREVIFAIRAVQMLNMDETELPDTRKSKRIKLDEGDDEGDEGPPCICGEWENGQSMVECDGCRSWYHLECMGIRSEADLEDKWFCTKCEVTPVIREPVLVPSLEEAPRRGLGALLPFYQLPPSSTPPSPSIFRTPRAPRKSARNFSETLSSMGGSSWRTFPSSPSSYDPASSKPPVTPGISERLSKPGVMLWSTPVFENRPAPDSPFDPTSTPSRGLGLGLPLIMASTPFKSWPTNKGPLFGTPNEQPGPGQKSSLLSVLPTPSFGSSLRRDHSHEFGGALNVDWDATTS